MSVVELVTEQHWNIILTVRFQPTASMQILKIRVTNSAWRITLTDVVADNVFLLTYICWIKYVYVGTQSVVEHLIEKSPPEPWMDEQNTIAAVSLLRRQSYSLWKGALRHQIFNKDISCWRAGLCFGSTGNGFHSFIRTIIT